MYIHNLYGSQHKSEPLYLQLGIPKEAMAIALAVDVIADFIVTAFEMLVLPMTLIQISAKPGMIDRDILRRISKN